VKVNSNFLNGRSALSLAKIASQRLLALRRSRAETSLTQARALIPHQPSPLQLEFLALTCEEALFGGAAGGGKSDAGLMAALQYVHVPGYSGGIFRRTKVDLLMPDAILARAPRRLALPCPTLPTRPPPSG
jgi:hypothetical protein